MLAFLANEDAFWCTSANRVKGFEMSEREVVKSGNIRITSKGCGTYAVHGPSKDETLMRLISGLEGVGACSWSVTSDTMTYQLPGNALPPEHHLLQETPVAQRVLTAVRNYLSRK